MKKYLRKILAMTCVAVFLMSPSTAFAASVPVLTHDEPYYKQYVYQPAPYHIRYSLSLYDLSTSDGKWHIEAGKYFSPGFVLSSSGSFTVTIVEDQDGIVYQKRVTAQSFNYTFLPKSRDADYLIRIDAESDIYIESYHVFIIN